LERREKADEGAYCRRGFGGLAAAAYPSPNAEICGQGITIYEADRRMGGGFFLGRNAVDSYNLPGSVFDKEFRNGPKCMNTNCAH
jgi:hypothetical protein